MNISNHTSDHSDRQPRSPLSDAIARRIADAGRPASNLDYATMERIRAQARIIATRRRRNARIANWAIWIIFTALMTVTIVKVCWPVMSSGYGSLFAALANPDLWSSPTTLMAIAIGTGGLLLILANTLFGSLYDRLMARAILRHHR